MASVTYNGSIKTSDPRYREGYKIVMSQQSKKKKKSSKSSTPSEQVAEKKVKQKLTATELNTLIEQGIEYLEEQRKEHIKDGSM